MKKNLSIMLALIGFVGIHPAPTLAAGMEGKRGTDFVIEAPKTVPTAAEVQVVHCRLNRLTDLVFPGKITKVVMSDHSGDFKLDGTKVGPEDHLIVEPLKKGAASDFFIVYGTDRVSYLKVKTVPDGQEYDLRFDAKGNREVLFP